MTLLDLRERWARERVITCDSLTEIGGPKRLVPQYNMATDYIELLILVILDDQHVDWRSSWTEMLRSLQKINGCRS